ncbi:DNA polymerase III subunit gamma/tau [Flavobacterium sp. SUN046]|uniref:DNA polymerase III subunit gamma/tau n=1 Tax=Flavobacterium sp. SUN046 TaxID=3002440 RepID=UPI002DBC2F16|nr:DNA polymerase III subunit gamma/tau [Flavobacterium sp. SUN046]MEC4050516.1 DNA polymerase III subunit gamma/tau [Flavobacterium sp. SUN046]
MTPTTVSIATPVPSENAIPNETSAPDNSVTATIPPITTPNVPAATSETKFSALSLGSIRAKKEMLEAQKGFVKEEEHLPSEAFTKTQMLEYWYKYADRLGEKGHRIMEALLRINEPELDGYKIIHEMPNEGSKIDFDREKYDLLAYLRGHLHNHDISIEVLVNEEVQSKTAFTAQDKYNRLNEINPNLEKLKKMFDLEL